MAAIIQRWVLYTYTRVVSLRRGFRYCGNIFQRAICFVFLWLVKLGVTQIHSLDYPQHPLFSVGGGGSSLNYHSNMYGGGGTVVRYPLYSNLIFSFSLSNIAFILRSLYRTDPKVCPINIINCYQSAIFVWLWFNRNLNPLENRKFNRVSQCISKILIQNFIFHYSELNCIQ